jgi:hypothetical protein
MKNNGLLGYNVVTTTQNVNKNYIEDEGFMNSPEGLSFADGDTFVNTEMSDVKRGVNYSDLGDVSDIYAINDDNFYNANGRRLTRRSASRRSAGRRTTGGVRGAVRSVGGTLSDSLQASRDRRQTRVQSRANARELQAKSQLEAAKGIAKGSQADMAIAKALATPKKKGLSTGAIIGIVVGGVLALGVIAFIIVKNKNKNK